MIDITETADGNFLARGEVQMKGNRVSALIKHNTHDKINKLETIPFNIQNENINTILDNSNFIRVRRKLGKALSENGKAGVFAIPHMGSYILDTMIINDYSKVGNYLEFMEGTTGATFMINGTSYDVITHLFMSKGKPYIESYASIKNEDGEIENVSIRKPQLYKGMEVLPAELFVNNEDELSDIEYADIFDDLQRLDYLDSQYMEQWELSAAMTSFNTNWTDNDPANENRELRNGRGYTKEDGHKAKLREGSGIVQGNASLLLLQNDLDYLENIIRKNLGLHMISGTDKGTNKTIIEIIGKEQIATEQLLAMKEMREYNWQTFFNKLALLLKETAPVINQEFSLIEQSKIDLLQASVVAEEAKGKTNTTPKTNTDTTPVGGE